MNTEKLILL